MSNARPGRPDALGREHELERVPQVLDQLDANLKGRRFLNRITVVGNTTTRAPGRTPPASPSPSASSPPARVPGRRARRGDRARIGSGGTDQYDRLVGMSVEEIGAFEAKTRLSELLRKVGRGHVYRITRRGKPIAELRPVLETRRPTFGADRGRVTMTDDFDAPIDDLKAYR